MPLGFGFAVGGRVDACGAVMQVVKHDRRQEADCADDGDVLDAVLERRATSRVPS